MNARPLHRWTMTVFALLLAYWVVAGLLLAVVDVTDRDQTWAAMGGGPGASLIDPKAQPIPAPGTLGGIPKAIAAAQSMPIASVSLYQADGITRIEFAVASGDRTQMKRFNAATGEPLGEYLPGFQPGKPTPPLNLRDRIKAFHMGKVIGLPGQILDMLSGLALIVMVGSGTVLLYRSRRMLFKPMNESRWRRAHRWVAMTAAVLILNIAVTGTILAAGEIDLALFLSHVVKTPPYPIPGPMPPVADGRLGVDPLTAFVRAFATSDKPVTRIDLTHREERDKALVTGIMKNSAYDAATGASIADPATTGIQQGNGYFADWHQVLKRLHRGDIIGHFAGRYIDIAAGLALLYLIISGMVMYVDLRGRRVGAGRKGWFWK